MNRELIRKYNVPCPRYTSYPTVPYWDNATFDKGVYIQHLCDNIRAQPTHGISLYIHLPYCESLCTFCGCNKRITRNHGVEMPYIAAVLSEWKMYVDRFERRPVISELHLGGGTPTFFSPENLTALIDGIRAEATFSANAKLSFEAHPNNTSDAHLQALRLKGFKRLSLGVQDFDPVVQRTINRVQSFAQVRHVTEKARDLGYQSINFDLVYGLPKQTLDSVKDTVSKVLVLKPERIAFYSYAHVPWKSPGQRGFDEHDLPDDATKMELYTYGKAQLLANGYMEVGMDHFALAKDELAVASENGTLHRNFMGYTVERNRTMIGLGVSAIGDSWQSFGQNVRTLEEYHTHIAQGELPISNGHILTSEDLRIRQTILDLMCRFECIIDVPNGSALYDRLAALRADGLLVLTSTGIVVMQQGRAFIRNICMALDERYWKDRPVGQVFSKGV